MIRSEKIYKNIQYLEYLPSDYLKVKPKAIILYFHGLGEVGDGLDAVDTNEIPKLYTQGVEKNYITICPYLASGTLWYKNTILAMLDLCVEYKSKYGIDKVIVTGISLGGVATISAMQFAQEKFGHNTFFAAAGVVCGKTGYTDMTPFKATPIKAWHGTTDSTFPINNIRVFRDRVVAAGGECTLTEYVQGHTVWDDAYQNAEFWAWADSIVTEPDPFPIPEIDAVIKEYNGELFAYAGDKKFKITATLLNDPLGDLET
jgi:predicted peptidase